jgi:DNA polymerase I-like protein with 3'-5' exonuclease and polymerase domains
MRRYCFDVETDGLLPELTKIHCLVIQDVDTGEVFKYPPGEVKEGLKKLAYADVLIAHNGIGFDLPAIQKIYPKFKSKPWGKVLDTLVYAKLVWSNRRDLDFGLFQKNKLEGKYIGSHSLKSYGYRLGILKGDFSEGTDWQTYSEDMLSYCEQDVAVTTALFKQLESYNYSETAIKLEMDVATLMTQQERNGFYFNEKEAANLYAELSERRGVIHQELLDTFGAWYKKGIETTPKRTLNFKDKTKPSYVEGAVYTKVTRITFNPASRAHIAKRLKELFGWESPETTEKGQPKIDETTLQCLGNEHSKLLIEYFMLQKRIGQLAEGDNAWLKLVREGKLHGRINTNGAVTGRATHHSPNIAQVPSGNAIYGKECRSLFTVPDGYKLFGCDASGLELRCLGHYMSAYDGGEYNKEILEGDIHTANQNAAGLSSRPQAKTFIYAFLYGAGDVKVGSIVHPDSDEETQRKAGRRLKSRFLKNTPALKTLRERTSTASERGYLKGLDGRQIFIRSKHAALNSLLQSAGAIICKAWLVELDKLMSSHGFSHSWQGDYVYCAWVHDELQIAVKGKEALEAIKKASRQAIRNVEVDLKLRCPLDSDYSIGSTWADTH